MLKTGIIGAGGIAWKHCEVLHKLGVEIAGIYDINSDNARRLGEAFGAPVVLDAKELTERADMVHIFHAAFQKDWNMWSMRWPAGNIFLWKTGSNCSGGCKKNGRGGRSCAWYASLVGFTQRFRRGYKRLWEWMEQGKLGDVVQVYCFRIGPGPGSDGRLNESWRTAAGYVCGMTIESLSHDIDFLQSFAGKATEAKGFVKGTVAELPQFDNNVSAALKFESGAIGAITASWSSHVAFNVKGIIGTKGSAMLMGEDIWDSTRLRAKFDDGTLVDEVLEDIFQEGEGYLEENRHFLTCIKEGISPLCGISTGREVLEVSHKILASSTGSAEKL